MDFIPKSDWQWVFDKPTASLTLQMGDDMIDIAYKSSMLAIPNAQKNPFTVEDVARYMQLFESISFKGYESRFACQIILHILAIELFHKPIMPKSWLFANAEMDAKPLTDRLMHVSLTAKGSNESAHYLLLESDTEFALCMLIDQLHCLTERKILTQFQIVKVTLDKLNIINTSRENSQRQGK